MAVSYTQARKYFKITPDEWAMLINGITNEDAVLIEKIVQIFDSKLTKKRTKGKLSKKQQPKDLFTSFYLACKKNANWWVDTIQLLPNNDKKGSYQNLYYTTTIITDSSIKKSLESKNFDDMIDTISNITFEIIKTRRILFWSYIQIKKIFEKLYLLNKTFKNTILGLIACKQLKKKCNIKEDSQKKFR